MNNEQEVYTRLYMKMGDYSNSEFPITDFLNDIINNKDKNFNKEGAYNDLEKMFDTFMEYHNEVEKYKQLEKEIGCPLKVYAQLKYYTPIYDENGNEWYVDAISIDNSISVLKVMQTGYIESNYTSFKLSDHKKTWWLKENKGE